jgi:hypothetical protein
MSRFIDLTGKKFGRLLVLSFDHKGKDGTTFWRCKCDCGKEKDVRSDCLTSGSTMSCGCLNVDLSSSRIKHGDGRRAVSVRLYRILVNIKQRCENKKHPCYKHYGERGIKLCSEWRDYSIFKQWALENGYQDNLSIDRINNDGNYEPSNCRWVSQKIQTNNTRSNRRITWRNMTKTRTQWAEYLGVLPGSLDTYRRKKDCTYQEALDHFAERLNIGVHQII